MDIILFEVIVEKRATLKIWRQCQICIYVIIAFITLGADTISRASQAADNLGADIIISKSIELTGQSAVVDSYRSTLSAYNPLDASAEAIVTVNSNKANSVALFNNAIINGDVYTGHDSNPKRALRLTNDAKITGTVEKLQNEMLLPSLTAPKAPPFDQTPAGNVELKYDLALMIDSDSHINDLSITGDSVLTIEGNLVILLDGDLTIGPDAHLEITPGSTLDLYVMGSCNIAGRVNAYAADPQALYLFMLGQDERFEMSENAAAFCILQNPAGHVDIQHQTQFFGKIKANSLECAGGIHVDLDSGFPSQNATGGTLSLKNLSDAELTANSIYELTWTTDGAVDNVIIEYSTDGRQIWTTIDTVMNTGSYEWTIPSTNSQQCYLRVLDAAAPSNGVLSEAFTIYICELTYDLNSDCKVDAKDAEIMAKEWLKCGNPFNPDCK